MQNYEQERQLVALFRQLKPTNQRLTVDCVRGVLDDQFQEQVIALEDTLTAEETNRLRQIFERSLV